MGQGFPHHVGEVVGEDAVKCLQQARVRTPCAVGDRVWGWVGRRAWWCARGVPGRAVVVVVRLVARALSVDEPAAGLPQFAGPGWPARSQAVALQRERDALVAMGAAPCLAVLHEAGSRHVAREA